MRLLWVDEDGPDKFVLETDVLESNGWTVEWALGVPEAAQKLRETDAEPFRIILLDQHIAEGDEGTLNQRVMWGACRLLYWLRGTPADVSRPWLGPGEIEAWSRAAPAPEHRDIPVLLVSAFHDNAVLEATRKASARDRFIKSLSKPLDSDELLRVIDAHTRETQDGDRRS